MNLWRPLDAQADWISQHITPQWTRRIASSMLDLSLVFFIYAPFSGEPPVIYIMSVLALLFAAIIAVVEAEKWKEEKKN